MPALPAEPTLPQTPVSVPVTKRRSWSEKRYLDLLPCSSCGSEDLDVAHYGNDRSKKRSVTVKCCACRISRTDAALRHDFDWIEMVAEKNWNQRPVPLPVDLVLAKIPDGSPVFILTVTHNDVTGNLAVRSTRKEALESAADFEEFQEDEFDIEEWNMGDVSLLDEWAVKP